MNNTKEFLQSIRSRRSVYPNQFSDEEIDQQTIQELLECANQAPTHRLTEPWRFKVFLSKESKINLANFLVATIEASNQEIKPFKIRKTKEKVLKSAAVIAICMQRDPKEGVPEWEEIAATAMAVQNLWLAAQVYGLGGYWSSPSVINNFGEHIPLNEGERCLGFFYLGKIATPSPNRTPGNISEKTVWL